MKLGKREIDALACPPGQADALFFDEDLTGFALRVTKSGAKTFLFQYRRGASTRRYRIGQYGDLTPAQARKLAETLRLQVAAGGDPVAERQATLAAEAAATAAHKQRQAADALTFAKLVDQWEAEKLRHRSGRYQTEAPRALRFSLAALADLPAASIDAARVRQALAELPIGRPRKAKPGTPPARPETMMRRAHTYGRAMFNWAIKRDLVAANPFAAVQPEGRETPRERFLTDAELGEVWSAAGALGWPWTAYFRFLLLTLQRETETAGLRRAELAPDMALWQIPGTRTKNRKPHLVHLAEPARAILREAPRKDGADLVFTTTGTTPISGFSHAKARLDAKIHAARAKAAGTAAADTPAMPAWRLHDFRRTGVTALARLGVRWEVADRLLNHVSGAIHGVAAIYQRHDYLAEREAAMKLWADHVMAAAAPFRDAADMVEASPSETAAKP